MLTGMELEDIVTESIDKATKEMLELNGEGISYGGKAESSEVLGSVGKRCGADRVSGKDVCEH